MDKAFPVFGRKNTIAGWDFYLFVYPDKHYFEMIVVRNIFHDGNFIFLVCTGLILFGDIEGERFDG
jgi:hypothetical protein